MYTKTLWGLFFICLTSKINNMFLLGILVGVAITLLIELLILLYLLKRAFYDSFKDLEQLSSIQEEEDY